MDVNYRDVEGNILLYVFLFFIVCLYVYVFVKLWYVYLICIIIKEIKWIVYECYKIESREIMFI